MISTVITLPRSDMRRSAAEIMLPPPGP
jgi:hypothetical protein